MSNLIGGLPETDELVKWLQEQAALKGSRAGSVSPSYRSQGTGGVPTTMGYNDPQLVEGQMTPKVSPQVAESYGASVGRGSGAGFLGSLGTAAMLAPAAISAGRGLGHMYLKSLGKEDLEGRPARNESDVLYNLSTGQTGLPSAEQVSGLKVDALKQPSTERTLSSLITGDHPMSRIPVQSPKKSETPSDMNVHVDIPQVSPMDHVAEEEVSPELVPDNGHEEDDPYMKMLSDVMGAPAYQAPQEEINPASTKAVSDLSKNRVETPAPVPGQEGFGHKIKRLFRAGQTGWDFSAIDKDEAAARQQQNQFTDPERLKGEMAKNDIIGAQKFNREGQMAQYENGGMSPQMKFLMDLIGHQSSSAQTHAQKVGELGQEHGYRMEEIGANAANQKLSPEQTRAATIAKIMEGHPDLDPSYLQELGLHPTEASIRSIQEGRTKDDVMKEMMAELMRPMLQQRMQQAQIEQQRRAKNGGKPIAVDALSH